MQRPISAALKTWKRFSSPHGALIATTVRRGRVITDIVFVPSRSANCNVAKKLNIPICIVVFVPSRSANCNLSSCRLRRLAQKSFSSPHGALIATENRQKKCNQSRVFVPSRSANCNGIYYTSVHNGQPFSSPHGALIATILF